MKTGLDHLLENLDELKGKRIGVCCNHTAIDQHGNHILDLFSNAGIPVSRIFGPEPGIDATAQDMISVEDAGYEMVIETVSLYGDTEESLHQNLKHWQIWIFWSLIFKILVQDITYRPLWVTSWKLRQRLKQNGFWIDPIQLMVWMFKVMSFIRDMSPLFLLTRYPRDMR